MRPDFIIHTGDVVTAPNPAAYALAAETLGALQAPVYYVVATTMTRRTWARISPWAPRQPLLENGTVMVYAFEVAGALSGL